MQLNMPSMQVEFSPTPVSYTHLFQCRQRKQQILSITSEERRVAGSHVFFLDKRGSQ